MAERKRAQEKLFPSTRLGMSILWFYGALTVYVVRNNFSVSIVCMTIDPIDNDTSVNDTTPSDDECQQINREEYKTGVFYWDRTTRGLLNSAFSVGYLVANFIGGILTHRLGPKWIHFGGIVIITVSTLLCPVSAEASEWALLSMRMLLGFGYGTFTPSTLEMLSNWSPTYERSTLFSIHSSGYSVGSVVAFSMSGALCDSLGWESTFYVPALFSIVYLILIAVLGSNGPEDFKCTPDSEREYIVRERSQKTGREFAIPWAGIFTSVPCWSIFICNFSVAWGNYTVLTSSAQYMSDVLKFDIKANGGYNALPQLSKFCGTLFAGFFIDYIRRKKWVSATNASKLAQTIAMPVSAAMMIGMGFMTCEHSGAAIAMLCICEGFSGFCVGVIITMMAVAPRFVPVIVGIGNSFSQFAGVICPVVAGLLTVNGTRREWQIVFLIGAAIYLFGWLCFMLFSSTEVQPWAVAEEPSDIVNTTLSKNKDDAWNDKSQILSMSYTTTEKPSDVLICEYDPEVSSDSIDVVQKKTSLLA